MPYGFFDANNILSSADIVVLTTLSGMKNFYSGTNFSNIDFNLNTECNDEIDADISNTLQSIIDKKMIVFLIRIIQLLKTSSRLIALFLSFSQRLLYCL